MLVIFPSELFLRAGNVAGVKKKFWDVHSIDIHPSRKHTCLAGGSSGTVFAWDLRWPQQPLLLSGVGSGEEQRTHHVKKMVFLLFLNRVRNPLKVLAEPCAINSFDIDRQYPSDICSLEWESIAIVTRP
ncbi:hypothetical protein M0R45_019373 [Rubus argutus]|uniref:Uncharacterized protein n=1 Tax=Rubus argutus TaxID=59490 RepID=A0AAW1X764_RUBAR